MKRISAIIASEMAEIYLLLSSSTTSQLPQDRPVCLPGLNSSDFFHTMYKHNCKTALPTCVYMHLIVNKSCFCALLNRDLRKQTVESRPRCSSVLPVGTAGSQSQTQCVVTLLPILCRVLLPPSPWSHNCKRTLSVLLNCQHLHW